MKKLALIFILAMSLAYADFQLPASYNYTSNYFQIPAACWNQSGTLMFKESMETWNRTVTTVSDNGSISSPYSADFSSFAISPTTATTNTATLSISTLYSHPQNLPSNLTLIWQTATCYQAFANQSSSCGGLSTGTYGRDINTGWCYQESSNATSSCGGLSTGTYAYDDQDALVIYQATDGNWSTYYGLGIPNSSVFINYTKPSGASALSVWRVGIDNPINDTNVSIPINCWNADAGKLMFKGDGRVADLINVSWQCWNSTAWQTLAISIGSTWLWEEGMWWYFLGFENESAFYDNNETTCSYVANTTNVIAIGDFFINYTKPSGTTNASQLKIMTRDGYNETGGGQVTKLYCWDGAAWSLMGQSNAKTLYYNQLCDNAMLWDLASNISIITQNNIANGTTVTATLSNFTLGQNVSLQIQCFDGNFTTYAFSTNSVLIESPAGGGGGGGGILPPVDDTTPTTPPEAPTIDTPIEEVINQIEIVGAGGAVPNSPLIADWIANSNPDYIGEAAATNIAKTSTLNIVLAEYQGIQSLFLKLPFFDLINVGYISIIFFGYLLLWASKKQKKKGYAGPAIFGFALIMLAVSIFTMIINEGLLLFATKAISG